jgi:undecaprenyl diphosphate synthase
MDLLPKIDKHNIPKHVAIIMDGNGRWAKEQGKDRIFGHFNGVESVRAALKAATRCGVQHLTLYAFSTENWNRPQDEVNALMDLLVQTILNEIDELHSNEVRLHAIGDISNLPTPCISALKEGMERTSNNSKINLHLALSYSSRWEIIEAVRQIIREGRTPDEVNAELISSYLCTKNVPDPELVIRTSGERRISNFLLWQIAYAELHFTQTFWPDFRENDFYQAILDYQNRERRFGKTSEQLLSPITE